MQGVQKFLQLLNDNWITILVCLGCVAGIVRKTVDFFSKSYDEKIKIAKSQIQETILKMISDAECEWEDWNGAGSQVIEEIYRKYPILSKVKDQTALTEWIDNQIKESLKTLREIVATNTEDSKTE